MNITKILTAALLVVMLTVFSACGGGGAGDNSVTSESASVKEEKITVTAPKNGEKISLSNDDMSGFLKDYYFGSSINYIDGTLGDRYFPNSVTIEWSGSEENGEKANLSTEGVYAVEVSFDKDLKQSKTYYTNDGELTLENLQSGKTYYFRIRNRVSGIDSGIRNFVTKKSTRTIKIDGVSNTRDIGGYSFGIDGEKTVKQGMVYRGAAPDEATEQGKKTFGELGIKTIIDLREETSRKRAISGVNYVELPEKGGPCYVSGDRSVTKPEYTAALIQSVKVFADESNYPVYFHCQIGRDRTGTLAFILSGLLGVDYSPCLCLDYELSCFSEAGCRDYADGAKQVTNMTGMFNAMNSYFIKYSRSKGDERANLQSGIEWFLKDNGVTEEEISNIKRIMTE